MSYLIDTKAGFAKPVVREFGRDGNAFALIAQVAHALKEAGHADIGKEFTTRAMASGSYDEVLQLCMQYGDLKLDDSGEEEDGDSGYDDDEEEDE